MVYVLILMSILSTEPVLAQISKEDSSEILNVLISEPVEKYQSKDKSSYNALAAYKGWGELYDKYHAGAKKGKVEDIKVYLFLGFVAQLKSQFATSEAFISDVHGIFVNHKGAFFDALKENQYLISSTCYYLGRYFGFESKHDDEKPGFLQQYSDDFQKRLSKVDAAECLKQLDKPTRPTYKSP